MQSKGSFLVVATLLLLRPGRGLTCNTRLADLSLVDRIDDQRLEVVAMRLPGWSGSRRCGCGLRTAARRGHTRSCFTRSAAAWLSWPLRPGGRWSDEAASFLRAPAQAKTREALVRLWSSLVAVLVARRSALLSHAAMSAFAATFTKRAEPLSHADGAPSPLAGCLPVPGRWLPLSMFFFGRTIAVEKDAWEKWSGRLRVCAGKLKPEFLQYQHTPGGTCV